MSHQGGRIPLMFDFLKPSKMKFVLASTLPWKNCEKYKKCFQKCFSRNFQFHRRDPNLALDRIWPLVTPLDIIWPHWIRPDLTSSDPNWPSSLPVVTHSHLTLGIDGNIFDRFRPRLTSCDPIWHVISGTMDFSELKDGPPAPNTLAGCIQWYISSKNLPEPIIPINFPKKLQGAMGKYYPHGRPILTMRSKDPWSQC